MSETPTTPSAPTLEGLAATFRHTASLIDTPDGSDAAAVYRACAQAVDLHTERLREQPLDSLDEPALRIRLAVAEGKLAAALAENRRAVDDVLRAALGVDADTEVSLGELTVTGVIAERHRWRDDYDGACKTLAAMHAAAMGGVVRGPVHGVVEDVWWLRVVCDRLASNVEDFLGLEQDPASTADQVATLRERLDSALLDARRILHPADAEEHPDPIDTVNAVRDVIECRSTLARVAVELDELPRLPEAERKARRETLRDLCREHAGRPPYEQVATRIEILLGLLHDAWGVIANAGLHRGNWDHEHPEWVTAAQRWRDRFHTVIGVTTAAAAELPDPTPFSNPSDPVNLCEADTEAVRRFAGEIERLRAGLHALGITEGAGPWGIPVAEWPVTAALHALRALGQVSPPVVPFGPDTGAGACCTMHEPTPAAGGTVPDPDPAMLPELAAYADDPDATPNAALTDMMRHLAAEWRGVAYDPHDRPSEILAVRRAAFKAGLIPFPSEHIPPRSIRGAIPPAPKPSGHRPPTAARTVTLLPGESVTITAGAATSTETTAAAAAVLAAADDGAVPNGQVPR